MTMYQFNLLLCEPKVLCSKFTGSSEDTKSFAARLAKQTGNISDLLSAAIKAEMGVSDS